MAWKERSRVDERGLLIGRLPKSEQPMAQRCHYLAMSPAKWPKIRPSPRARPGCILGGVKTLWMARTWLGLSAACVLAGCGSESSKGVPIPVPNEFDAYFVAGTVCMPTNAATGTGGCGTAPSHPIRFDICRHRCITLDRTTARVTAPWQCAAGQCNMLLLAYARAHRVQAEQNCDGRELPSPPPGTCTPETFSFSLGPPCPDGGDYVTGAMMTAVPFMTLPQAQEVSDRVAAGENVLTVVPQVAGPPPASHQWVVNYDPSNPVVSDAAALGGADCHAIPAP